MEEIQEKERKRTKKQNGKDKERKRYVHGKKVRKRTKEQNGYVDREYQLQVEETNFGNRSSLSCQYEKDKFC